VNAGTFRLDLYYRLAPVRVALPPLRERLEDLRPLIQHFLNEMGSKQLEDVFEHEDLVAMERHTWPGNIRELQHAIERAIIMAEGDMLDSRDFFFLSAKPTNEKIAATATYNLDEMEKSTIQRAIDKNGGNISKAAKELGLTRASLYRRLEKYGL
jgi:transcriptional regulator with PAS, ATPase and Fis domain